MDSEHTNTSLATREILSKTIHKEERERGGGQIILCPVKLTHAARSIHNGP